ncbi:hypothetical protein HZF24_12710 [Sedimentibacter hydroxybenzoicus DSM 7310]|uniref:Uncharacterized protein n=1 Tax=Sedimentibacter hydroxybenzoicus DSM 7310 TaxID=1123245 RepID=A0A974BLF9_SEDHY|nr:hypothetical protein [Sedimentibacter hydroxybenzoicus]NYB75001.1 hypothetical protein [Sedimentibacter hydroxybenzoicus DSM 7310]
MKKQLKIICSSILVIMMLFVSINSNIISAMENEISIEKINIEDYPKNSRERFVASLALEKNISYEEADKLEKEESIGINGYDEEVRYKSVDEKAGKITGGSNYSQDVYIATEVRCVWNKATNKLVNIEHIGGPVLYLPGVSFSNTTISGGDIVIEQYPTTARISRTVVFTYTISGVTVTLGGDILSISTEVGKHTITTRAKTYAININESVLRRSPNS